MRPAALVLCVAALCLGACGPTGLPLQAEWYYAPKDDPDHDEFYLAILNQGDKLIVASEIIINGGVKNGGINLIFNQPKPLEIGKVKVWKMSDFNWNSKNLPDPCLMPVTVAIVTSGQVIEAGISGGLPNALPKQWVECK